MLIDTAFGIVEWIPGWGACRRNSTAGMWRG